MKIFVCVLILVSITAQAQAQSDFKKAALTKDCERLCGEGFFYDRPGAKNGGQELVCTRYKLKCGYECTIGWNFEYLLQGTNYTCQDAIQFSEEDVFEVEPELIKARSL
ncbi:MAG: hypothetical protein IJ870_06890 [Alphaproteobacteria bacterium]|nr:hypothetical protein [Alphaproteobacteria bacterium]